MKKVILIFAIVALLAVLAGCKAERMLDRAEDRMESILDPEAPATSPLTKEQAEEIALEHAGLTREQVQWVRSDYDFDDGHYEYDIEIHAGEWDYELEIHSENGNILSYNKERADE